MSAYIRNLNINRFYFIGISDRYDESIRSFKKLVGIEGIEDLPIVEGNPTKGSKAYDVKESTYEAIVKYNSEDMELYLSAVEIFNQRWA